MTITLGTDYELIFLVALEPMFADPEEIRVLFPDASIAEIAELIYLFSLEAQEVTALTVPTALMFEFVVASVLCALSRIYDFAASGGNADSFTLGDLTVSQGGGSVGGKANVTRPNAVTWCELAGVLREELYRSGGSRGGMRAIVKGSKVICPMPRRHIKHQEFSRWPNICGCGRC